jgi:hypothetical protein
MGYSGGTPNSNSQLHVASVYTTCRARQTTNLLEAEARYYRQQTVEIPNMDGSFSYTETKERRLGSEVMYSVPTLRFTLFYYFTEQ